MPCPAIPAFVTSRSPCGSADRNTTGTIQIFRADSRSPCGSADRNSIRASDLATRSGRSPCGSADRNFETGKRIACGGRRSPCGSADRNACPACWCCQLASLPVRERGSKPSNTSAVPLYRVSLPCGSADRNRYISAVRSCWKGRSPCGSADRNVPTKRAARAGLVAPVRERGSNILTEMSAIAADRRSRAGARIETTISACSASIPTRSLPVRERGSKRRLRQHLSQDRQVAPRAGARIET